MDSHGGDERRKKKKNKGAAGSPVKGTKAITTAGRSNGAGSQSHLEMLSCVPNGFSLNAAADDASCADWQSGDEELWLVRVPRGFPARALNGVGVSLDGKPSSFKVPDSRSGKERTFSLRASAGAALSATLPHLLLPDGAAGGGALKAMEGAGLRGQISVAGMVMTGAETDELAYVHRRVQPLRGLKQRVFPFGRDPPVVSSADLSKAARSAAKKRLAKEREEAARQLQAREEARREAAVAAAAVAAEAAVEAGADAEVAGQHETMEVDAPKKIVFGDDGGDGGAGDAAAVAAAAAAAEEGEGEKKKKKRKKRRLSETDDETPAAVAAAAAAAPAEENGEERPKKKKKKEKHPAPADDAVEDSPAGKKTKKKKKSKE